MAAQNGPVESFSRGGDEKKITLTQFDSMTEAEEVARQARARGEHANVGRLLRIGDRVNIEGLDYEVKDVRSRGRVLLKLLGESRRI